MHLTAAREYATLNVYCDFNCRVMLFAHLTDLLWCRFLPK